MRSQLILAVWLAGVVAVAEQDPSFEVASVKPNKTGDGRMMFGAYSRLMSETLRTVSNQP